MIAYREEIFHPGLLTPVIATGLLREARNGWLVREQTTPVVETTRLGETFLSVEGAAGPNLLPIPDSLRPTITAMRALVRGDTLALRKAFALELSDAPEGWRLDLTQPGADRLAILGCGDVVRAFEIAPVEGARRVLHFGDAG
ncbi:MAG: LolA-related protein [Pseudomonadota bacterium]